MDRKVFETTLKKKVSQITFSGHRVNDEYSLNKRRAIVSAVMSAFDEVDKPTVSVPELRAFEIVWDYAGICSIGIDSDLKEADIDDGALAFAVEAYLAM